MLEDNPEQQLFGLTYMLERGFKKVGLNTIYHTSILDTVSTSSSVNFTCLFLHYEFFFIQLDLLKSGSREVAKDEKENHTFLQLVNKIFSGWSQN